MSSRLHLALRTGLARLIGAGACASAVIMIAAVLGLGPLFSSEALAQSEANNTNDRSVTAEQPLGGNVPGGHLGTNSDAEIWRAIKDGMQAGVTIPNKQSGVLIQRQGEDWRNWRNTYLFDIGVWAVLGIIGLLALFFVLRGRIEIDAGSSDQRIERFNGVERFVHWMTAVSFVVLGLTGLNLLYGKFILLPLTGPEIFGLVTIAGKYAHNYLAFPFMIGVVLMFVLWVRHNIPNLYDLAWVLKGGGMVVKGSHPPARKFNFGQKIVFWLVILSGISLSLSGISLLFPFQFSFFEETFQLLNLVGLSLPTGLTAMQEMQLSQLWHGLVGLVMIAVIIAHIYIGTMGMEGAFDAMGTGMVDENWARGHHSVWVAEVKGEPLPEAFSKGDGHHAPAAE